MDWGSRLGAQQPLFFSTETGGVRMVDRRGFPTEDKRMDGATF